MKIMIIIPFFQGLKSAIFGQSKDFVGMPDVFKFLEGLVSQNHDMCVVLVTSGSVPSKCRDMFFMRNGSRFYIPTIINCERYMPYPMINRCANLIRNVQLFFILIKLLKSDKPDIIYAAFQNALVASVVAAINRIPLIIKAYGTHLGGPVRPGKIGSFAFSIRNLTAIFTLRTKYNYLIMLNDGTKGDVLAKTYGVDKLKFRFWMNGVDRPLSKTQVSKEKILDELNIPVRKQYIMSISRLKDWKRVDRIIHSIPYVINKCKDLIFVIVGDGPEMLNLKKLAQKLNIVQHTYFTGYVSHDNISKYLQIADIFISVYDLSNLCNPLLEAMMHGKCIISLDDGSLNGVVKHGENGYLIAPKAIKEELPAAIIKLLNDNKARKKLGNNAKHYATKNFDTWQERINKEIVLLESTLRRK